MLLLFRSYHWHVMLCCVTVVWKLLLGCDAVLLCYCCLEDTMFV